MNDDDRKTVYLASRYQNYPQMQEWAARLESIGYMVVSRWIKGGHEITADARADEDRARFAEEDLSDVLSADIFICHSDPSFFGSGRGGRHVELGIAISMKKEIILIGERENVFHWLPTIKVFRSFEEAFEYLRSKL